MERELVTVFETQGILVAEVIKGKLESAGIPALLKYESAGLVIGVTVDGLGMVQVMVPASWEADALAVLEEDHTGEESDEPEE